MHIQCYQFLNCVSEYAGNDDAITSPVVASGSDGPQENNRPVAGKQLTRFRVTTAEEYPNKRRRV